jgi:glyoxylase-like metal-dependent hydrolase (beta-lactamase superfamily II)
MRATSPFVRLTPTPVDIRLKEGDNIGGLTLLHTPGHKSGSISLLDMGRKALFVGDTLRIKDDEIVAGPEKYTWDAGKEVDSIRRIASLDFNIMLLCHGEPFTVQASEAVRKFCEIIN